MHLRYIVGDVLIIAVLLFFGWGYSIKLSGDTGKALSMLTAVQMAMVVRQIELRRRVSKIEMRERAIIDPKRPSEPPG